MPGLAFFAVRFVDVVVRFAEPARVRRFFVVTAAAPADFAVLRERDAAPVDAVALRDEPAFFFFFPLPVALGARVEEVREVFGVLLLRAAMGWSFRGRSLGDAAAKAGEREPSHGTTAQRGAAVDRVYPNG